MKVINLLKLVELHPRNFLLIACNYIYSYLHELIDTEGKPEILFIIRSFSDTKNEPKVL